MAATAEANFDYVWRRALFSLILIGWGIWSIYDGTVAYPRFNETHGYAKYTELREACRQEALRDEGEDLPPNARRRAIHNLWARKYRPRFRQYLENKQWWDNYRAETADERESRDDIDAVRHLEEEYHGTWDIRGQFIMAIICLPLGLISGGFVVRNYYRNFRADEEGLHGFGKDPIPYSAIDSIDRSKWENKGIAKLRVEDGGKMRKVVLDDWKFKGMNDILARIERERPELAPPEKEEEESSRVDGSQ